MDNPSDDVAFTDQQLEETRERYIEELDGNEFELENYNPQPQASGSKLNPRCDLESIRSQMFSTVSEKESHLAFSHGGSSMSQFVKSQLA